MCAASRRKRSKKWLSNTALPLRPSFGVSIWWRSSKLLKPQNYHVVIAIDEYKGDTREGKYQLIIADGETREPIDILPNRKKGAIKQYLQQHGAAVEIVVMDMSHSFKDAVKKALGKPVIIADRFHFCRYIYWALDAVRRRVQKSWNDYDRKKGKRMRYVFYKNSEKLTEKDRWYLKRYLEMDDELKRA